MLWYLDLGSDRCIYLPPMDQPGSLAHLGRLKSKVQLHLDCKSVSRVHAEFRPGPEPDSLILADLASRYGTRVNGRDVGPAGPAGFTVRPGDQLEFGDSDPSLGAVCRLGRQGLRVCFSALGEAGRQSATSTLHRLGGRVVDDARDGPDLLMMPRLTVTAKLVLGLLHQATPVLPDFLTQLAAAVQAGRPPPPPERHRPAVSEAALLSGPLAGSVDFGPRPERRRLLSGRRCCFLQADGLGRFRDIVEGAGGVAAAAHSASALRSAGLQLSDLSTDAVIVVRRTGRLPDDDWTGRVCCQLRSASRRPVLEQEICWAVLACRTDLVCNPLVQCDPELMFGQPAPSQADTSSAGQFSQRTPAFEQQLRKRSSIALAAEADAESVQPDRRRPRLSEIVPEVSGSEAGSGVRAGGILSLFDDESPAPESDVAPTVAPSFSKPPPKRLCSESPSPKKSAVHVSSTSANVGPRRRKGAELAENVGAPQAKRQASMLQYFNRVDSPLKSELQPSTSADQPAPTLAPPKPTAPTLAPPKPTAPTLAPLSEVKTNIGLAAPRCQPDKMLSKPSLADLTLSEFPLAADESRYMRINKRPLVAAAKPSTPQLAAAPAVATTVGPGQALWDGRLVPNFKRFVSKASRTASQQPQASSCGSSSSVRSPLVTRLVVRNHSSGGGGSVGDDVGEKIVDGRADGPSVFDLLEDDDEDRKPKSKKTKGGFKLTSMDSGSQAADRLFDDLFT